TIPLGTQTVGGGPTTGTLVRVENAGGQAMDLATPSLAGNHPNDFVIEVESSGTALPSQLLAGDSPSPLVAVPDDRPGVAFVLDRAAVHDLRGRAQATLADVELPDVGPVTFELVRRALPITADSKL